nr:hypothetical protein [Tanacetum cinerariifolium]
MSTLKFADTYNMVVFLEKPTKSEGFEQTVDFLSAHTLRYSLTVNPTIYDSCIEQFWSTAMAKTINEESQIHSRVDGKEIIITESSVRREIRLADKEGSTIPTDPQHTPTILQQLSYQPQKTQQPRKPKKKNTQVPQPSGSTEHVANEAIYKSWMTDWCQEAMRDTIAQTRFENMSKLSNDSLLVKDDAKMFDLNDSHGEEVFVKKEVVDKEVSAAGEVNAASIATTVSTAATIITDEITLAQARMEIKTSKPKAKGKAKKNVRLVMDKLVEMKLELILLFWSIAMAKTINEESQIHARVDGKEIIITESSVRREIRLADKEGSTIPTDPQHTPTILQQSSYQPQKTQQPRKPKKKNTQAATNASSLEAEQDNGNIDKTQSKATSSEASSLGTTLGGGPRFIDLEKTKTTQALEITSLKKRVKKLKKKQRSRTHKLKRLYKVGLTAKVDSSKDDQSLDDAEMFDLNDSHGEEVFVKKEVMDKEVSAAGEVNAASIATTV